MLETTFLSSNYPTMLMWQSQPTWFPSFFLSFFFYFLLFFLKKEVILCTIFLSYNNPTITSENADVDAVINIICIRIMRL